MDDNDASDEFECDSLGVTCGSVLASVSAAAAASVDVPVDCEVCDKSRDLSLSD